MLLMRDFSGKSTHFADGETTPCHYSPPKKRGPKPVQGQDIRPREPLSSTSPATDTLGGLESPALLPAGRAYSYPASDSLLSRNSITADALSAPPESQTQTAVRIHIDLLAGLLVAAPSNTAASITNHCILLYTQYVFGTVPMCHEATLRATVSRFFISPLGGVDPSENPVRISRCFAADNEQERIGILRSLTLLTALCAAVTYVLSESLLPNKHLTAPLFLRAARETLRIYEDYDLQHPDSSSLIIRLFLSSAIQIAKGMQGVAFHILSEAGLIAMRMGLYDESSLEGREPIEETLLRNAFWQLYVCDKTAFVMKARPVTINESLFTTELTLKTHSQSSVLLFEIGRESSGTGLEGCLVEGFHVIRRLWAMAARVIQAMESNSKRTWDAHADMQACRENIAQLSEAYFDMITLTNWTQSPGESSPGVSPDGDQYLPKILQRQRTSYLISLHCIKIFVLNTATQCNMTEVMGLSAEPLMLAMRQIELAQDFLNVLESVPFLHLQAEGEHCAEKIRRVGSLLLELAHTAENDVVKFRANQCAIRLIDMLARLNSKASDVLVH
ncbi:hypothetical protein N7499_013345 [Penicillium canescens]|uniref:Transcription factor domain-containing protein n=1 Tax=Penicillium canescens TaxID=5083 RepID=A0AAD6N5F6_PENCN|nr:uncharacterized protein N7446_000007 [Penicillium canescens]KAJ6011682.1 hypothetical protein N7522_002037 [Penicillium canescens]KAJ6030927.1 hypothetical protein N7460_011193 [Penicillium canescens]KAJ6059353.1 hypothetical protein N7444_002992 [Penicillium canescens]KAJ6064665.1 hypothetical protein N7499_013345 [Penicillium canescens]KAJ6077071.1 hypothetical protein N7446_000007 [Penicillium canescens]